MLEATRPFICERCRAEVPAGGGGICLGCDRMLCARHFPRRPPDRESAKLPEYACEECQRGG